MLPSQVGRYGPISHYKKLWLMQTQMEKQEQAACQTAFMKESSSSSKSSSIVALHGSGDGHAPTASQFVLCRRMEATGAGFGNAVCGASRAMNGIPANSAIQSSASPDKSFNAYSVINLRTLQNANARPDISVMGDFHDSRPRLSLAVHYGNVSDALKTMSQRSISSSSQCGSLMAQALNGSDDSDTVSTSFSADVKQLSLRTVAPMLYHASSSYLVPDDQLHVASDFCKTDASFLESTSCPPTISPSAIGTDSGSPRACSLCGTSRTPLWRSGPVGPKSLCNACGIRMKKTKRLEAVLQVASVNALSSSMVAQGKGVAKRKHSTKLPKEAIFQKKKRMLLGTNMAKQRFGDKNGRFGGLWEANTPKLTCLHSDSEQGCATALAEDVEEAAVLLMALSCGLVLS